ncbi:MAG: lysophospholipid acyltransferase family protein [Acidobacteriota bacterium]|nr:lysophospholipid acyltransferase family protein [Blastocatellia bacterium]MDW8411752.1 lysophospholipid acyltransferase family protein [Acidobacteriota bacterium]
MSDIDKFYIPQRLENYPFWKRIFIQLTSLLLYCCVYLIGLSMRWEVRGASDRRGGIDDRQPLIYAFWHNRIIPATWFFRHLRIVVMTSQSADGEIIARVIQRFGYGAARGSTTRGGSKALRELADCLKQGRDVAFTIDGPRGPIYVAKPGAILLAKLSGCPVLPVCQTPLEYYEMNSWDKFRVPKPFTCGLISYAPPIYVPKNADEKLLEQLQQRLQKELDRLHAESELWRQQNQVERSVNCMKI